MMSTETGSGRHPIHFMTNLFMRRTVSASICSLLVFICSRVLNHRHIGSNTVVCLLMMCGIHQRPELKAIIYTSYASKEPKLANELTDTWYPKIKIKKPQFHIVNSINHTRKTSNLVPILKQEVFYLICITISQFKHNKSNKLVRLSDTHII